MDENRGCRFVFDGDEKVEREGAKPVYVPPRIVTYTSEELLEQVGPAMACTSPDGGMSGVGRHR